MQRKMTRLFSFFDPHQHDIGLFAEIPQDCIDYLSSYLTNKQLNRMRVNHDMNNLVNNIPKVKQEHQRIKQTEALNQYNKDILPTITSSTLYIHLMASYYQLIYGDLATEPDLTFKDILTLDIDTIKTCIFDMSMGAVFAGYVDHLTYDSKYSISEMALGATTTISGIYGSFIGYCSANAFLKHTSLPNDLKFIGSFAGLMIGEYVAAKSTRAARYVMAGGNAFHLFKQEKQKMNSAVEEIKIYLGY